MDRFTGRSRGFAFVRFDTAESAGKAKDGLNGQPFQGKTLVIDWARTEQQGGGMGAARSGGERRERPMGGGGNGEFRPRREWGGGGNDRGNDRGGNDRGGFRGDRGDRGDRGNRSDSFYNR
jgi:RNA recognition motif-containing protein